MTADEKDLWWAQRSNTDTSVWALAAIRYLLFITPWRRTLAGCSVPSHTAQIKRHRLRATGGCSWCQSGEVNLTLENTVMVLSSSPFSEGSRPHVPTQRCHPDAHPVKPSRPHRPPSEMSWQPWGDPRPGFQHLNLIFLLPAVSLLFQGTPVSIHTRAFLLTAPLIPIPLPWHYSYLLIPVI